MCSYIQLLIDSEIIEKKGNQYFIARKKGEEVTIELQEIFEDNW